MIIMMKNICYNVLFFLLLGLVSCDGDNKKVDFSIDGEWEVYERRVVIREDASSSKDEIAEWGKELTKDLNRGGVYLYNFGDVVSGAANRYEFSEKQFPLKEDGTYDKDEIFPNMLFNSGTYIREEQVLKTTITVGVFDNWQTDFIIKDLNKEHLMFVQELDAEDLGLLYYLYLGYTRSDIDKSVKAQMITKAKRLKNKD